MNILIDIGHPAHVHYYKNLAKELEAGGNNVFWTVKEIPVAIRLLDQYGFKYLTLPKKSDCLVGKIWKQLLYDIKILDYCHSNKIDIAIGTSVSIAHVSRISKIKSIVFDDDDDDVQPLVTKYVNPYADTLLSPEALKGKRKRPDTIFYPGYHELAYLHPKRFTPNIHILKEVGIIPDERFFIMRFNVFKAHHDIGVKGLSLTQKLRLIDELLPHGRVLITTERDSEPELSNYQLKISPENVHSLMYYSTLFLGDSQTMTSEAAVLGVPSLRCNSFAGKISYLEEEEHKYGLTFAFQPDQFELLINKLRELLAIENIKSEWRKRRDKMLSEKIDVTSFWRWFIVNYPKSKTMVKDTTEFWEQFK